MKVFSSRIFRFILAILVGMTITMLYGWFVHPSQATDTSLDTLRVDYKTDYVLMVSEAYKHDKNLSIAIESLSVLGEKEPIRYVQEAIISAQDLGYSQIDMEVLAQLAVDIQSKSTSSLRVDNE